MSTSVLVVAACWLATGAATAALMWRRGHDGLSWLLIGFVMGPVAPLFAVQAWHRRGAVQVVSPGRRVNHPGPVDVLVGVDGSPRSLATVAAAVELLGPRLGRLTVAQVVPHDAGAESDRLAAHTLETLGVPGARLEVLHGRPATALIEHTVDGGYDLLVVGARGAGLGSALLGSTARELAGTSKVPVLVVGPGGQAT